MVIAPEDVGAVTVSVSVGALASLANCPAGIAALKVTEQVSKAPELEGSEPQLTVEIPRPAETAVATAPVGSWSTTVADVPLATPPPLPSFNV